MSSAALSWAGALTLAALVGLGIFAYPALLRHRWGGWLILVITSALAAGYFFFDRAWSPATSVALSAALALLWAAAPVIAALIVRRL